MFFARRMQQVVHTKSHSMNECHNSHPGNLGLSAPRTLCQNQSFHRLALRFGVSIFFRVGFLQAQISQPSKGFRLIACQFVCWVVHFAMYHVFLMVHCYFQLASNCWLRRQCAPLATFFSPSPPLQVMMDAIEIIGAHKTTDLKNQSRCFSTCKVYGCFQK